jgi:hypothetical protein
MKKDPDHNSTDSAEIEALITRLERGQLRDEDAQLLARLLRLLLRLITLLQQKNASLSRLKRLLFGPRSDKRRFRQEAGPCLWSTETAAYPFGRRGLPLRYR